MDPSPFTTTLVPDQNGRPLSQTRQGLLTQFSWTPGGQLSSVTPPSRPLHQLLYDGHSALHTYVPPTLGGTDEKTFFNHDFDGYLHSIDAPGWDDLTVRTDPV